MLKRIKFFIMMSLVMIMVTGLQMFAFADTLITSNVEIVGVDEPEFGCMFPESTLEANSAIRLKSSSDKYELTDLKWKFSGTGNTCGTYCWIGAGEQYYLQLLVSAKDGYYFDARTKVYCYVEGVKKEMSVERSDGGKTLTCKYEFERVPNTSIIYGEYWIDGGMGYITGENCNDVLGPYDGDAETVKYIPSISSGEGTLVLSGCIENVSFTLGGKIYSGSLGKHDEVIGTTKKVTVKSSSTNIIAGLDSADCTVDLYMEADKSVIIFNDSQPRNNNIIIRNFKNITIGDNNSLYYANTSSHNKNFAEFISCYENVTLGDNVNLISLSKEADIYHFINSTSLTLGENDNITGYGIDGALFVDEFIYDKNKYEVKVYDSKENQEYIWDGTYKICAQIYTKVTITPKEYDGWVEIDGEWYLYKDGKAFTGWYQNEAGTYYYLDDNGKMLTGWQKVNEVWYYLNPKTGAMTTGWVSYAGKWYYMSPKTGAMVTGWLQIGKTWYYLLDDGAMATGWKYISNKWYYFTVDGDMKTGWLQDGKNWYYLNAEGDMRTGWLQEGVNWYYLMPDGHMKTGWLLLGTKYYYFKSDGVMACNQTLVIAGKSYTFDKDGVWVK